MFFPVDICENEVIDVLLGIFSRFLGVDDGVLTTFENIVLTNGVVRFEFILRVVFVVKVLDTATIGRVPDIGGEVTAIGLGAVMTASDFAALAPLEELAPSCSTAFACWPTTIVD